MWKIIAVSLLFVVAAASIAPACGGLLSRFKAHRQQRIQNRQGGDQQQQQQQQQNFEQLQFPQPQPLINDNNDLLIDIVDTLVEIDTKNHDIAANLTNDLLVVSSNTAINLRDDILATLRTTAAVITQDNSRILSTRD